MPSPDRPPATAATARPDALAAVLVDQRLGLTTADDLDRLRRLTRADPAVRREARAIQRNLDRLIAASAVLGRGPGALLGKRPGRRV